MLGNDHRVEPCLFGMNGLLDELLGVPLFVTTEIGESGQEILSGRDGSCQVYW